MNRRLPVFFLLDTSESMAGQELYDLEEALRGIVSVLQQDPHALETVFVEFLAFAGKARKLTELQDLMSVQIPELPIGGGTSLGAGLNLLMSEIDTQVRVVSSEDKGDWKPLVFLITDGVPTDDPSPAIEKWNSDYKQKSKLIAISISGAADTTVLSQLTDTVLNYYDTSPEATKEFVRWISQSISSISRSVMTGGDQAEVLAPLDGVNLEKASDRPAAATDERYAVIIGRCSETKHPYLAKYRRDPEFISQLDLPDRMRNAEFVLTNCVPLRESYFDMSSQAGIRTIDVMQLLGQPDCPHCQSEYSLAIDSNCGNAHCVSGEGLHICPWCGAAGEYGLSSGEDDDGDGMQMRRGQG